MWALVDCDNFFCSCERIYRPELNEKPVVVLSNNDGCVVARSNEAKKLGIKMGLPYFQMKELYPESKYNITAFSSNYRLYSDISDRVTAILRETCPVVYKYSIDEAMLDLTGMEPRTDLKKFGEELAKKIYRWVGVPVSLGIAPTKTLAKVAVKFAKDYPGYRKCCYIKTDDQREKALRMLPVEDVWGIGRRNSAKLEYYGVHTAWDYTLKERDWVKKKFTVFGERTWMELRGEDVIPIDEMEVPRKSIMTSRSFPELISDLDTLRTHVSNFAVRSARKLRKQGSVCRKVSVFIQSSPFREDLEYYSAWDYTTFLTPCSSDTEIIQAAFKTLDKIYRKGIYYKRAGVMVDDISDADKVQPDLFLFDKKKTDKYNRLSAAMDKLNETMGNDTVIIGSQQYKDIEADGKHRKFSYAIKRALKSPDYTAGPDHFIVKLK